ncbi:MAG TPA: hypothetical protein VGD69_01080 [Herpetosiphonaceae bacterium]
MEQYQNLSGDSGVVAYEIGDDSITVEFSRGGVYRYDYESAGREAIERMKELAHAGRGLNTYINQTVKQQFAEKLN